MRRWDDTSSLLSKREVVVRVSRGFKDTRPMGGGESREGMRREPVKRWSSMGASIPGVMALRARRIATGGAGTDNSSVDGIINNPKPERPPCKDWTRRGIKQRGVRSGFAVREGVGVLALVTFIFLLLIVHCSCLFGCCSGKF